MPVVPPGRCSETVYINCWDVCVKLHQKHFTPAPVIDWIHPCVLLLTSFIIEPFGHDSDSRAGLLIGGSDYHCLWPPLPDGSWPCDDILDLYCMYHSWWNYALSAIASDRSSSSLHSFCPRCGTSLAHGGRESRGCHCSGQHTIVVGPGTLHRCWINMGLLL